MIRILLFILFAFLPIDAFAAARFLVACTTSCTWDNSSTAIWSTTSGGAPGSAAPTSADAVTLDANSCVGGLTCTITVNANLSIVSLTGGACTASTTGCILDFSVNNNSITISSFFDYSGTGTRTLKMGSNTWTLSGPGGGIWNISTSTNFTLTAGTSTILVNGTGTLTSNFNLGTSLTYATITFAHATDNAYPITLSGTTPTITTFNVSPAQFIQITAATTYTITNAINWVGTGNTKPITLISTVSGTASISTASGTATCTWCVIGNVTFTGGATFNATNSINAGGNAGITLTGPSGGGRIIGG